MSDRKLSDIIIEIAMQGLTSPKYSQSDVMHPLFILSHIAWNGVDRMPQGHMDGPFQETVAKFSIPKKKLKKELISEDWKLILNKMIEYRQARFPDDTRIITSIGPTSRGTLRVEWLHGEDHRDSF